MKMRKIIAVMAAVLMLLSILPMAVFAADNMADLNTLAVNTSYTTRTTTNKWVATNSATAKSAMTSNNVAVILNGKTSAKGTLTSPTLSNGIAQLSFSYGYSYKESNGVKATINIKDASGAVLATDSLVVSSITQNTAYTYNWDVNPDITGDFVIEILNNSPSNSNSNKDRLSIWNVTWESAASEPEVPSTCEHNYVSEQTKAPTCTAAGETTSICSKCNDVKTEPIAALGHSYGAATETVAPDCTNAGEQQSTCSACGDVKTETVKALGHTFVDGFCSVCNESQPQEATITFDADKTQRIEFTTETQKWENDGLVLINNKGTGNNIADYTNPIRMYKGSEIIISFPSMTSLVIDAAGVNADYLWDATLENAGLSFTVANKVYTITFAEPTDSITLTAANQVRANSITAMGACTHVYDNDFDADCNKCGDIREVSMPITSGGKSASEDVSGLAFLFNIDAEGISAVIGKTEADYTNATLNGYKLISMGAIASNGSSSVDIPAKWLCELSESSASYAVRVINIPERGYNTQITAVPYFVVEIDGEQVTIEGEAVTGTYNGVTGDAWS